MNPVATFTLERSVAFIEYLKFSLNDVCIFSYQNCYLQAFKPWCKMKILRFKLCHSHIGNFEQKLAFLLPSVCLYGYCHTM